jgi:hypothetical protein
MSLSTNVIARYPNQILVNLTRAGDTTATTVDATKLGYACTDIEAYFLIWGNSTYDDTNARHVAVCVPAVILILQMYSAQTQDQYDSLLKSIEKLMKDEAKVDARDRFAPVTSSTLTPSAENPSGGVVRPFFDYGETSDFTPDQSGTGFSSTSLP